MRIEAITGSRIEELKCWTREEWAEQGVDVDVRLGQGRRPHHWVRIDREGQGLRRCFARRS